MPTLLLILLANLLSTLVSVGMAAALSFRLLSGLVERLVNVSIGLLLATALTHMLPEAFAGGVSASRLGWVLLAGILGFFVMEKATLIHHTHHHEGDTHDHGHGHDAQEARRGAYPILIGDAFHNFGDGVLIASAFMLDLRSGVLTALAVMAHEIPHEIGDFMILLNAGLPRRRAFLFMLLSGTSAMLGGLAGYLLLESARDLLPYALTLASASFVYIALSDLLPEMMRRSSLAQTLPDVALVMVGVVVAAVVTGGLDPG